ncbi:MAG: dihydrodipicolinate synthase family protein [Bacteroidota bacterium]
MTHKITGLIAATFTPFREDGSLWLEPIEPIVAHLIHRGVQGIFVCGSTGEGPSLTSEERKIVAEAYVQAARGRLFVFVHVGHNSLTEAAALARHAQQIGADAISATAPNYYKTYTLDTLVASLRQIAEGAPHLPLFYYHIPVLTGVDLDMTALLQLAGEELPTLAGIKYTSHALDAFHDCMQFTDYQMLFGRDELLLSALVLGTQGFIGSTYNFAAPLYQQIWQAYEEGNHVLARQTQLRISQMVRLIHQYGGLPPQKAMMKMIGLDCGPVRLPLAELTRAQKNALQKDLEPIWDSE